MLQIDLAEDTTEIHQARAILHTLHLDPQAIEHVSRGGDPETQAFGGALQCWGPEEQAMPMATALGKDLGTDEEHGPRPLPQPRHLHT